MTYNLNMLEKKFQSLVINFLKEAGAYVINYVAMTGTAGIPDLIVSYCGRFVALELKTLNNKASALQIRNLENINKTGGFATVFRHSDDWKTELKKLLSLVEDNAKALFEFEFPVPPYPKDAII